MTTPACRTAVLVQSILVGGKCVKHHKASSHCDRILYITLVVFFPAPISFEWCFKGNGSFCTKKTQTVVLFRIGVDFVKD